MKKILNYVLIFIFTLFILFIALAVSSKIPRSAIEENLKESTEFYKKRAGIYRIKNKHIYSYIHYFADTRKLNIIYCLDSDKPIESMLWSKYYQTIKMDTNKEFIDLVEKSEKPTTQYLRYWNGCMLFLRPLLTFLNMEQIYLLNEVFLAILTLVLIAMLLKKSKKAAFIYIISLILVACWYIPLCIEYSVTFYVMTIASIIAIKIDSSSNNNDKLLKLFLVTGIITTFIDFLTTEILTIFVPLALILIIRKEENRLESFKNTFIFLIKSCILWFIGYCGMWLAKWVLSSIILNINAFEYVKENAMIRVNGLQGLKSHEELYQNVIGRNFFAIPLMYYINMYFFKKGIKIIVFTILFIILLFIDWKELKNKKYLLFFVIIGCVPYIRYLVLANHSYRHAMFTFRDQMLTIISLIYIIIESLNYRILSKKIKFKSKKLESGE